jgi:anthranilate synthase component 1
VPLRKLTLAADLLTPVGAFLRLREAGRFPFLMESATGGERFGRYSIIGCDPSGEILAERPGHAHSTIGGQSSGTLLEMLKSFPQPNANAVAPFGGGLVGVIGFDWIFELRRALIADIEGNSRWRGWETTLASQSLIT